MNPHLKTPEQIKKMQTGGKKLSSVLNQLIQHVSIGMQTIEIDTIAEKLLLRSGGQPSFKTVPGYHWSTCININDSLVHGVPNKTKVQDGDIITIDIGLLYQGLHTDLSTTFQIGKTDTNTTIFLQAGKTALKQAINQVKPGRHIGHISKTLQTVIERSGYHCVPELIGHGIGENLHEYPPIPGVLSTPIKQTPILSPGMTLAIEVIYVAGSTNTITDKQDRWTIRTQDGKISAVFEKTIAVVSDGCLLLTP